MKLAQHIKEHAALGMYNPGLRTLTVGSGSQFSTIQAAIDFIEAQNDSFIALANTHTDYYDIGGATYVGISAKDWAIDSNLITLNLGIGALDIECISEGTWIKLNDESRAYKFYVSADNGKLVLDHNRIEASFTGQDKPFTVYRENPYTIELTDSYYTEQITIDADICVIFKGNGSVIWETPFGSTAGRILKGANFTYGVMDFQGVIIGNPRRSAFLDGGTGESWDNDIAGVPNTIELRVRGGSTMSSVGADYLSADVSIGSVIIEDVTMHHTPNSGGSHFLFFSARGTVQIQRNTWAIKPSRTGVVSGDCFLIDGTSCRHLIVSDLNISLDDLAASVANLIVVNGAAYAEKVDVARVHLTSPSANPTNTHICRAQGNATGASLPAVADIRLSGILINMQDRAIGAPTVFLYEGWAAHDANVKIVGCDGGLIVDNGNDTITCLSHDIRQNVAYAATITPDANLGNNIVVGDITAALTVAAPDNPQDGQRMSMMFTQNATGNFAITWNAAFAIGTNPTGAANEKAVYEFIYDESKWVQTNAPVWA